MIITETTQAVKDALNLLKPYLSFEDRLIMLENTHSLARWVVENSKDPIDETKYLVIHDEISLYYCNYVKSGFDDIKKRSYKSKFKFYSYKIGYKDCEEFLKEMYHNEANYKAKKKDNYQ